MWEGHGYILKIGLLNSAGNRPNYRYQCNYNKMILYEGKIRSLSIFKCPGYFRRKIRNIYKPSLFVSQALHHFSRARDCAHAIPLQ